MSPSTLRLLRASNDAFDETELTVESRTTGEGSRLLDNVSLLRCEAGWDLGNERQGTGHRASFRVESAPDEGTCVSITSDAVWRVRVNLNQHLIRAWVRSALSTRGLTRLTPRKCIHERSLCSYSPPLYSRWRQALHTYHELLTLQMETLRSPVRGILNHPALAISYQEGSAPFGLCPHPTSCHQ
jgi:hypothetical protein